jgi:hypothetical protein
MIQMKCIKQLASHSVRRLLLCCLLLTAPLKLFALEEPVFTSNESSSHRGIYEAADALTWELTGIVAGITYLGIEEWDWGSASFKFNAEGWFNMDTGSGGADKLGHLYTSYLFDEFLTNQLYKKSGDMHFAARNSAIFSWGLMMFVEAFDGYSSDHGFSYEDVVMNSTGIAISYLKNTVPGLDEKLDLRIEYHPSKGMKGFHPITDYTGLTYSAALKLAGFEALKPTPLKYLELQLGYYAQGFKKEDAPYFADRNSSLYFGIGLNLTEVLFKPVKKYWDKPVLKYADTFFRYYQAPATYVSIDLKNRKGPRR